MPSVKFDIRHPGISVYEALISKELSEEEKAKIIAEAIDSLSKEFPKLKDVATGRELSETELRLTKEIEGTRKEIKELELKLTKEIEGVRKEIKETKFTMLKWQFVFWISQIAAIIAILYKVTSNG